MRLQLHRALPTLPSYLQEAFKGLFGRFPNIKLAVDESEL
jgi:hypothetical protein